MLALQLIQQSDNKTAHQVKTAPAILPVRQIVDVESATEKFANSTDMTSAGFRLTVWLTDNRRDGIQNDK